MDPLPMSNFWERAREADSSNDGPKLWIKSQYSETVKLKEDVPEARTIWGEIDYQQLSKESMVQQRNIWSLPIHRIQP